MKKEIKEIAQEIYELQMQAQKLAKANEDNSLQSLLRRIEVLIEDYSPKEVLELNDAVLELIEKS